MINTIKASSKLSIWIHMLISLVLCLSPGCSKSITSIGPFEGYWSGPFGFFVSSDQDDGMIQFEVGSDRSVVGYGELWYQRVLDPEKALMFTVSITGNVNPNGSLECVYEMNWVFPGVAVKDWFPNEKDDITRGKISGFLNPAMNYGKGFCLSSKEKRGYFYWMAYRQQHRIPTSESGRF